MISPDAFRLNAYRVLRIPASASAADIAKAADRIRRAEAGVYKTSEIDIAQLGDVPRGDAAITEAIARLTNPVERLTDRLLWFCQLPKPGGASRLSSDMDPAGHDNALRALINISITAMPGGLDESGLAAWVDVLRAWHAVTSDDDFWFLALMNEDQGGFDPTATTTEADAVRASAMRIAAEPLLIAAHTALAAGDKDTVRLVLTALSSLTNTGPWAVSATKELETGFLQPCS